MRTMFVCGNWKMNGTLAETRFLLGELVEKLESVPVEVAVCPPFTSLALTSELLEESTIKYGAQNCYYERSGAFTGEISPQMLRELGCTYVILGHSERRTLFGETSRAVAKKLRAVLDAMLRPIVCIGETEIERENGLTNEVLKAQLTESLATMTAEEASAVTIAYEPVWAIGTGKTATPQQAQETHAFIRAELRSLFGDSGEGMTIQYGGSVKPDNALELFSQPDIDGGLIGGASLVASSFVAIVEAAVSSMNR